MLSPDFHIALEWDIYTWSQALKHWDAYFSSKSIQRAAGLEIGSRNGGLSFYFSKHYGARMCCSDYGFPSDKAKELHKKENVSHLITYSSVDACHIPFEDNAFDFVVFKSVLGAVGRANAYEKQKQAVEEMRRVLKPKGVLLFAENSRASLLHQWARRKFIPWGESWRYVSLKEMNELLSSFSSFDLLSTGFFAAFIPKPEYLKRFASTLDRPMPYLTPASWRYVMYGHAVK